MTKQQKIQEAFGKSWNLLSPSMQEHILHVHHWVDRSRNRMNLYPKDLGFDESKECEVYCEFWRPIQLRGIEDNNGWVKIESMDSFPILPIICITGILVADEFHLGTLRMRTEKDLIHMWQNAELTHYKIVDTKAPVY
ncbi:hypothetical protein [Chryseobacterium sp.]|uniref:hypothetical protein n=1 Tax=Chryseobacterium sp. TaxID=1871047 RepID=UPI00262B5A0F|nr:hypothetical protein [Chryseobacterium sp.]